MLTFSFLDSLHVVHNITFRECADNSILSYSVIRRAFLVITYKCASRPNMFSLTFRIWYRCVCVTTVCVCCVCVCVCVHVCVCVERDIERVCV